MEKIIDPINKEVIKAELSPERFVRHTRKGENEIYIVDQHNAPNVLQEIGRLREVTFRASGGGTGLAVDLDEFDTNEKCYQQLIVWSPEDEETLHHRVRKIVGTAKFSANGQSTKGFVCIGQYLGWIGCFSRYQS